MDTMFEAARSHKFTVTVAGRELGIMKVTGLGYSPVTPAVSHRDQHTVVQVVKLSRAYMPNLADSSYFKDWVDDDTRGSWREVLISLYSTPSLPVPGSPLIEWKFLATTKTLFFSELDSGSNQLLLEHLQLVAEEMKTTYL